MSKKQEALILYRLEQADESLDAAQILLEREKFRPSVSRSYYAMFYAVLALLAPARRRITKHSGAITLFDREFVKKGILDKAFSRWLHEAFDLRQRSYYREMFTVSHGRAEFTLEHTRAFVAGVEKQINRMTSKESTD